MTQLERQREMVQTLLKDGWAWVRQDWQDEVECASGLHNLGIASWQYRMHDPCGILRLTSEEKANRFITNF